MRILLLAVAIISFSSCSRVVMTLYGIKNPKFQTDESVTKYAAKKLEYHGPIYRVQDNTLENEIPFEVVRLPSILFADESSIRKPVVSCSADYRTFLSNSIDEIYKSEMTSLDDYDFNEELLYRIDGVDLEKITKPSIIVFYGEFLGRLNKRDVLLWMEQIQGRSDLKLILVNIDISKE